MSNATTIVPIGNFTPGLSRRVREMAIERAQRRAVVISMQSTERYSWSALYEFAQALRATITPYPIRLARALPRTRALLRELGIQREWFVDAYDRTSRANIRTRENPTLLTKCLPDPVDTSFGRQRTATGAVRGRKQSAPANESFGEPEEFLKDWRSRGIMRG